MNIKVKRVALIKALQKALKQRLDTKAAYAKAEEVFAAEVKAFEVVIIEAITSGKLKINTLSTSNFRYGHSRTVTLDCVLDPKKFKHPEAPKYPNNCTEHSIKEIENAIALLLLSEEEFVNANTYKSVSQYIA